MTLKNPLYILPDMITRLLEVRVSVERIESFLAEEDIPNREVSSEVAILSGVFSWGENSFGLKDINLVIPKNKLTIIIGRTGSGKSSLIHGLLGEMNLKSGHYSVPPSFGYVSQQAWLQNATIREKYVLPLCNCFPAILYYHLTPMISILFGSKYQRSRFNQVVRACALARDFDLLPCGSNTEVGDKGVGVCASYM
jgi:ATP-binding cassette subfamily C (CFTR/MRP) protein 1